MLNHNITRPHPRVSILIITKNRIRDLHNCLESILHQTVPFKQILIIDSSTDGETKKYISSLHPKKNIIYIFESKNGYAAARNNGISMARTPWLASVDDDCVLDPTWLAEMGRAIQQNPRTGVFVGASRTANPKNYFSLIMHYYEWYWKKGGIRNSQIIDPEIFDTKNILFRTDIFRDTTIRFRQERKGTTLLSTDDIDMGMQLYMHHVHGTFVPDAIIHHNDPTKPKPLLRKILFDRISYRRYEQRWSHIRPHIQKIRTPVKPQDIYDDLKKTYSLTNLQIIVLRCLVTCTNRIILWMENRTL